MLCSKLGFLISSLLHTAGKPSGLAKPEVQNSNFCFSPSLPTFLDFGVFSCLMAYFLIQSMGAHRGL